MVKIIVGTREAAECKYNDLPNLIKDYLHLMVIYDEKNPHSKGMPLEQIIIQSPTKRYILSETKTREAFELYKAGLTKTNGILHGELG